jgi:hypothetical protein
MKNTPNLPMSSRLVAPKGVKKAAVKGAAKGAAKAIVKSTTKKKY